MAMHSINAQDIIEKLGGIHLTATKLNVAISTVQGWKERNKIPSNRMVEIAQFIDIGDMDNTVAPTLIAKKIEEASERVSRSENKAPKANTQNYSPPKVNKSIVPMVSLGLSCVAVVLALSVPLWQGYVYKSQTAYKPMIEANEENLADLKNAVMSSLQVIDGKALDMNGRIQGNSQGLQSIDDKITTVNATILKFQGQTNAWLGSFNEKKLLIRQITSVALVGEPYSILLSSYDLTMSQSKNKKTLNALAVVRKNKNGIKTQKYLTAYLKDNARILTPFMGDKNAKTIMDKIFTRIQSVIYVAKIDASVDTQKPFTDIYAIINLMDNGDLQGAIDMALAYENKTLNAWAGFAQARLDTINALNILLGAE